jgi:hypothetical protein
VPFYLQGLSCRETGGEYMLTRKTPTPALALKVRLVKLMPVVNSFDLTAAYVTVRQSLSDNNFIIHEAPEV